MYPRGASFVRATSLDPGAICGLALRDKFILGLIGTTEDDFQQVTKHFVAVHGDDPSTFGGSSILDVSRFGRQGVFHLPEARFVPEISARSLTGSGTPARWLGLRGEDIFFCVQGDPFVFTFDVKTGKDSNEPIRDMATIRNWRLEVVGTDGHPITACEC